MNERQLFLEPCPYLPAKQAWMENVTVRGWGALELDRLLACGYRHFGDRFFQPHCIHCGQCLPVRVDVAGFRPNRSQKRVINRARSLTWRVSPPEPSREAFQVYQNHQERFQEKGPGSYAGFRRSFFHDHPVSYQLTLYHAGRLIGVCHLDRGLKGCSAVYAYFDSRFARYSPGTLLILQSIELSRFWDCGYLYLGYLVSPSKHMAYKSHFYPLEVLSGEDWVLLRDQKGHWQRSPDDCRFFRDNLLQHCFAQTRG